jgi:ribosomal protein S27AE
MTPVREREPIIPVGAWITAAFVALAIFVGLSFLFKRVNGPPFPILLLFTIVVPVLMAGHVILMGYVYGDARRRGMRYVLWTLLAIFIPNYIGVLLYFLMRDPLNDPLRERRQAYCSRCGGTMLANHAFCPHCGASVAAPCGACQRPTQPGWTHCPWCGTSVSAPLGKSPAPPARSTGP